MITAAFCKQRSIFIPFIMAGHPLMDDTVPAMMALAEAGADVIELGVPFSDPIADGPINQKASKIAIDHGMTLFKTLQCVQTVRQLGCSIPIILFSYMNPILAFGSERFCQQAAIAGVNGVLVVDLPPEEGKGFYNMAKAAGLSIVLLVSPTTDPTRLPLYTTLKPSFIYYISRLSVTGIQKELSNSLASELTALRQHVPHTKIAVGFGISSVEQAARVSTLADGVIVGSQLVITLEQHGLSHFKHMATALANAIHQV
jgi:tryptophan synthase alpha subunit